jgi:hypothetical protein
MCASPELFDPANGRFGHAFITCTDCGPRFTIVRDTPDDREWDPMASFAMCDDCRREYEDPRIRRFHAEAIACPSCGPRLAAFRSSSVGERLGDREALDAAAAALRAGEIVAIKRSADIISPATPPPHRRSSDSGRASAASPSPSPSWCAASRRRSRSASCRRRSGCSSNRRSEQSSFSSARPHANVADSVPYDAGLVEAERQDGAPIDTVPASPAVTAIERLADAVVG